MRRKNLLKLERQVLVSRQPAELRRRSCDRGKYISSSLFSNLLPLSPPSLLLDLRRLLIGDIDFLPGFNPVQSALGWKFFPPLSKSGAERAKAKEGRQKQKQKHCSGMSHPPQHIESACRVHSRVREINPLFSSSSSPFCRSAAHAGLSLSLSSSLAAFNAKVVRVRGSYSSPSLSASQ